MLVDLKSAAMQQDPYPTYAALRRDPSIVHVDHISGKNAYFITRHAEAMFVLTDPRFSTDQRKLPDRDDWTKKWYIPMMLKAFGYTMALRDEPDHTRLRGLAHKAFTPARVQQMSAQIEQIANSLIDAFPPDGAVDIIGQFSLPLALTVIGEMLGVEPVDRIKFARWMKDSLASISGSNVFSMVTKMLNSFALHGFLKELIASRRRQPRDDLTTALVEAHEADDRLSEQELMGMLFLLLFAGHETTVNLVGTGLLGLLLHPDQFEQLKATPTLMDGAIEELVRYSNPAQLIAMRYTLEEVKIGETVVPPHKSVMICVAAANRDETVFDAPEKVNITRSPNRHVAFGYGIHYCLGAPLARLEASIAFNTLFRRYPHITLAAPAEQLQWRGAPDLRGLKRLPVHVAKA